MSHPAPRPEQPAPAPPGFRDALVELVQVGRKVARMVGHNADAETNLAEAAAQAGAAAGASPLATSLADAIEADRAAAAAAEARQTVAGRTAAVAKAYAQTSRSIRLTIQLAERLDRGWARRGAADDRPTMAKRHIARAVQDAIAHQAEGERADRLTRTLTERLERLDTEDECLNRPTADIIAMICRDLGLDPACIAPQPPPPNAIPVPATNSAAPPPLAAGHAPRHPPPRPDG